MSGIHGKFYVCLSDFCSNSRVRMVPVKLLWSRYSSSRAVKFPSPSGIPPLKLLAANDSTWSFEHSDDDDDGILLLNLLWEGQAMWAVGDGNIT